MGSFKAQPVSALWMPCSSEQHQAWEGEGPADPFCLLLCTPCVCQDHTGGSVALNILLSAWPLTDLSHTCFSLADTHQRR